MMNPRTVRLVSLLIVVAVVAVAVLSALPANAATGYQSAHPGWGGDATASLQKQSAQQSALTRARAKAAVARRDVQKAVKVRGRAVKAAAEPARAYEAAVGAQARAVAAVGETQAALDRANAVLAGAEALRVDIVGRYEAGKVQFEAAAAAWRAAGEQMAALRTAQDGLVEKLNATYAQVGVVAGAAADVELKQIPAAAGAVATAWKVEQKARGVRVRVKAGWEEKRKAAGRCRPVEAGKSGKSGKATTRWECLSGGRWQVSKVLTAAAKNKEKAGREYRKAKRVRLAQEKYLKGLKETLAGKRTELAGVQETAKDLDAQVAAGRAAVSAAEQETSRLRVVADEWDKALDAIVAEGEKLAAEVAAAQAQQPVLAAAIAPLSGEVTFAAAQVSATQGAHAAAQAKVADASKVVSRAKKRLAKLVKKVKALSRH